MKKIELLIPVGNKENLESAIFNGADAVYLGGKKYGARAYSDNFNEQELIDAINLCHLYNVKIYVTVNTMIFNSEINDIIEYLKFLYIHQVDAVIMQDIGLINLTRKILPNLKIHVSTQAHNHNEYGIKYYKDLGCERVVFDRESSLEQINNIKVPIEKEIFIHGALCICYSGNCLFSALNGNRSANRGMCVGSCRLPYTLYKNNIKKDEGYLLSTKDLNVTEKLEEILKSDIDSLKVEGRMKSKEYVAVITRTYRKLIDKFYNNEPLILTNEEKQNIYKTYNREFTKGYLFNEKNIINSKSPNHQGIKIGEIIKVNNQKITIKLSEDLNQGDAIRLVNTQTGMYVNQLFDAKGLLVKSVKKNNICQINNKDRLMYKDLINSEVRKTIDILLNQELNNIEAPKLPVDMKITIKENNVTLETTYQDITTAETENIASPAINEPTTKEMLSKQLSKLGNTPFYLNKLNIDLESNLFINIKDINNLRRTCIDNLLNKLNNRKNTLNSTNIPQIVKTFDNKPKIAVYISTLDQLKICLANNIDYIYTNNQEIYNKYQTYHNIYLKLNRVNYNYQDHQENLLCTELGSIIKYQNNIRTDYPFNIANDYSIKALEQKGVKSITLSLENTIEDLNNIQNKKICEVLVYGYPENMIIKNNIFNIQNNEKTFLKNTKNQVFNVTYQNNITTIYNHEPINMIDKLNKIKGFGTYRIDLLNENIIETQSIITKLKDML